MDFTPESRPHFRRGVRLQHDRVRKRWLIQGPERAWIADDTAAAILRELDGEKTVANLSATLAKHYQAPVEVIQTDVLALLNGLRKKDLLRG